jgi:predicted DCC family thiol-disulfide oxidoreductase YuxK
VNPADPDAASRAIDLPERSAGPVLFYDGRCGVCSSAVQFVLRHERVDGAVRFARLGGPVASRLLAGRTELEGIDSLVWYEHAQRRQDAIVRIRSAAMISAAKYLGGMWAALGAALSLVPRVLRDRVYDLFARHRHRLTRSPSLCPIRGPDHRPRFLDHEPWEEAKP